MQDLTGSTLRAPNLWDYLRLLTASALWGATFILNEVALVDFSPVAVAAYRIIFAALLLNVICFWRGLFTPLDLRAVKILLAIGLLNSVVPFSLIGWGQLRIDSATTAILLATSPFFTLLFSHFMTVDDRFAWHRLIGLLFGFLGVSVLFWQGIGQGGGSIAGMLAIVLAGSCYALSSLLIRKLPKMPSLVLVSWTLLAGAVILLPALVVFYPPWDQNYRLTSLSAMGFLIVGPTATAYVLRAQIVKLNGALFMSNVGYLIPLFAVFWGWIFLAQQPSLNLWVALIMILFGVAIGQRTSTKGGG